MGTLASGTFHNESWHEETIDGPDTEGRKVTSARMVQSFDGDLVGTGTWTTIMAYAPDGTAEYVGMLRIEGRLGERQGAFVVSTIGVFDGSAARSTWSVVAGTGTDGFAHLSGGGHSMAPHGPDGTYTLEAELG